MWLHLPSAVVTRTEVLANVAIVVAVPVLAAQVWRPWPVLSWTGGAFCLSLAVEVVQQLLLGERVASATAMVADTAGGWPGSGQRAGCGYVGPGAAPTPRRRRPAAG